MGNKLTKETLKSLIEGVLSEKISSAIPISDDWRQIKNSLGIDKIDQLDAKSVPDAKDKVKQLASADGNAADLTDKDFLKATGDTLETAKKIHMNSTKPELKEPKDWDQFLGSLMPMTEPKDFKVGDTNAARTGSADKGLKTYEPKSIAFGQMANIGMQNTGTGSVGEIQLGIGTAMKELFEGKDTFISRIEAISNFTKNIFVDDKLPTQINELLSACLVTDYLSTIVKEIDTGTGAYQFEVFLAALAGGSVVGKGEVSPGVKSTGKMGAVDFVMADGTYGSSKYYASGSGITQSVSGFTNKKGKSILYIVALKKEEVKLGPKKDNITGGTADPGKIKMLNIYLISVMPVVDNPTKSTDFRIIVNGQSELPASVKDNSISITDNITSVTPIKLLLSDDKGNGLKDKLSTLTNSKADSLQSAYQAFQSLFKNLYDANQNAQSYASSGDKAKGNEALSIMVESDKQLVELVKAITTSDTTKGTFDTTTRKITEQMLKKIIEESLKKNK